MSRSFLRQPVRRLGSLSIVALTLALPLAVRAGSGVELEQAEFTKALKKAAPAKSSTASDGTAEGKLGSTNMRAANKMASEILERRMAKDRPNDLKLLREAGSADVIVVSGVYDRVQDVLRAVKVKHVVIPPYLVDQLPLMSTQTLMVNCPGNLSKAGVAKVRQFVRTGGFLVTTDWALTLLQSAFPGFVAHAGRDTSNDVVAVHIHQTDEPLLKHVQTMDDKPRWWLEGSSYPIKVLDKQRVKVLISSEEMRKKYGHAPIAVSFAFDDGKVLHMTSHFYLQQAKLLSKKEKAVGSSFAAGAGLKGKDLDELKKKGVDRVAAGELNSAYSMQQVTANVLVSKQASNKVLLEKYSKRAKTAIDLGDSASGRGKSSTRVDKDYRLRVLKQKDGKVLVRDIFGREGWADQKDLY